MHRCSQGQIDAHCVRSTSVLVIKEDRRKGWRYSVMCSSTVMYEFGGADCWIVGCVCVCGVRKVKVDFAVQVNSTVCER